MTLTRVMEIMARLALCVGVAGLAASSVAAAAAADPLDGTWLPAKAEMAGAPWPEQLRTATKLVIDAGHYTVTLGEAPPDKGTIKVDPSASPKAMDITGVEGPNAGKNFPCIYEMGKDDAGNDTLRICYDLSGQKRPTEFKSMPGTKLFLVTYARQKS